MRYRSVYWTRWLFSLAAAAVLLLAGRALMSGIFPFSLGASPAVSKPLPEFTSHASARWLNSAPLFLKDLRGQVVLLDVWTFG